MSITNNTPESKVESIFNNIAGNYDSMNNLISLGFHRRWRKKVMEQLNVLPGQNAVDLCCGTGDWTIDLASKVGPSGNVTGLDLSEKMLQIAQDKVDRYKLNSEVTLKKCDVMNLPYADNSFDVATIGFGLRNVPDASRVISEMIRVVRPGGKVACLETSIPANPILKTGWQAYFKVVPVLTKLASNKFQEYSYLRKTATGFFTAPQLKKLFEAQGLAQVYFERFMGGAVAFHLGIKPNHNT